MPYLCRYPSPLGPMLLCADEAGLTSAWFPGQKHFPRHWEACPERDCPLLSQTRDWLDQYFSGREPDFSLPLAPSGTPFQLQVWSQLSAIPYGETRTYGQIAAAVGRPAAAQAVGGAVGRNPLSVFIPCHRVLGAGGSLTGYAGGLDRKTALLRLEGILK